MKRRINEEEINIREKQGGERFFRMAVECYRRNGDLTKIETALFLYPFAANDCFPYVTGEEESIWPAMDIIEVNSSSQ